MVVWVPFEDEIGTDSPAPSKIAPAETPTTTTDSATARNFWETMDRSDFRAWIVIFYSGSRSKIQVFENVSIIEPFLFERFPGNAKISLTCVLDRIILGKFDYISLSLTLRANLRIFIDVISSQMP